MLSVLTGNVGINGGNSGVREGSWDLGVEWFPMLENPVKTQISVFTWTDAIDHGTEMTATRDGVREFGHIDILVNNAGLIRREDALEFSEKDWDDVMNLNIKSVFFMSQAAAKHFIAQGNGGKIINIASMLSFQGGILCKNKRRECCW